jgi:hypothetical protein
VQFQFLQETIQGNRAAEHSGNTLDLFLGRQRLSPKLKYQEYDNLLPHQGHHTSEVVIDYYETMVE